MSRSIEESTREIFVATLPQHERNRAEAGERAVAELWIIEYLLKGQDDEREN